MSDAPPRRTAPMKALDVGAGIGRITKDVLLTFCQHVDILESSAHFLDEAVKSLATPEQTKSLRFFHVCPLTFALYQFQSLILSTVTRTACNSSPPSRLKNCTALMP